MSALATHEDEVRPMATTAALAPLTVNDMVERVRKIKAIRDSVMEEGIHYGKIPGTDRDCLLKPGAEILLMAFGLAPHVRVKHRDLEDGHREYHVKVVVRSMETGVVVGEGVGFCSTMEKKYRWRRGERQCPKCGKNTIRRGDRGFYCWRKLDGCGTNFADNDPDITGQQVGNVENPDLADAYNTVLKMAKKRALVDAAITACGASELFTQDVDDDAPIAPDDNAPPVEQAPRHRQSRAAEPPAERQQAARNGHNGRAPDTTARQTPAQAAARNQPPAPAPDRGPSFADIRREARELTQRLGIPRAKEICAQMGLGDLADLAGKPDKLEEFTRRCRDALNP